MPDSFVNRRTTDLESSTQDVPRPDGPDDLTADQPTLEDDDLGPSDRLTGRQLAFWRILALAVVLVSWEWASGRLVAELLISRPSAIGGKLWEWLSDGTLAGHTWATAQATVLGFALGAGGGMVVGYVTATFRRLGQVVEPAMMALYTLPRLALAPMFILWFGLGMQFRVIFASVIVFFLVYFNTYFGVREVPSELVASVRLMGGSRWTVATKVVIPSALVWVAAGFKISLPYALVGVVVGEMLASNQGLGFLLARSAGQFNSAGTFAAIVALLIIALCVDRVLNRVTGRFLEWRSAGQLANQ